MTLDKIDLLDHTFSHSLVGYRRDEVDRLVAEAAESIGRLAEEKMALTRANDGLAREIAEYRAREATLRDTLLTTQRIVEELKGKAREEARRVVEAAKSEAAAIVAETAPRLLPQLTEKWVGMFVDRLLETVPQAQIAELCDGSAENEAALALAYVMFLESARMEKQMAEDLAAFELPAGTDGADAAAEVCRRLAVVEERRRQASLEKAQAYRRSRGN